MTTRAQSEVLGYVLVFSLIVLSAGIVYTGGIEGLQNAQQAEQLNNMGRAFDVLAANLADIHQRDAPSRATELQLSGGTLGFGPPVEMRIRATEVGNASNNATFSMNPRPLVYSGHDDTTFVYIAGAVIRTDGEASVMRNSPRFRVDSERTVIPFIVTYPKTDESLGGQSTVLVVGTSLGNELAGSFTPANDVTVEITVNSPRADAWGHYFEREGYTAVDANASDGTVTYQVTTERLYVYRSVIELDLER
ncbi:DUF7289 family protein [Haloarcula nitratireducens]|uniref:Uncharacterized protein n=1 Tax=Haloarcula nitratireducens TaxID=2487749 RepID=A0AAW4PJT9_9EURY|nr:hypothetical protein [Halomicroarcula nitratireducens]MBX0298254.1 hypothetical protein [Halomicroarcula nitratireducens]